MLHTHILAMLTAALPDGCSYYLHSADKVTEAQRAEGSAQGGLIPKSILAGVLG